MAETIHDVGGSEQGVLLYYLGRMREAVIEASAGLTDEQQRAAGVPSGTNLLGLVRHLTGVEEHWLQRVFLGHPGADPDEAMSMQVPADTGRDEVVAAYRAAAARSDEIVRGCADLSTRAAAENPGEEGLDPLRVILAHLLRETSRHAGHADILRELIDGRTVD